MSETLWLVCFIVLILLACIDYFLLWKLSFGDGSTSTDGNAHRFLAPFLSPFTLASQGAFAVFAALYIAEKALQGFAMSEAIKYSELLFLLLMLLGVVVGWMKKDETTDR